MSLKEFADALAESPASHAIVGQFWIVPTVQSIHIIAVAFVLTGSVVLAGRAYNLVGSDWTPQRWGRRLLPGMWVALVVLLATGTLLIVGEPPRELPNPFFQLKMAMLLVAVPLAIWLARRLRRSDGDAADGTTRALAAVLVLLWLAIISAARWIAYV